MRPLYIPLAAALILILLLLMVTTPVNGESLSSLDACKDFAYSTEEDFLTAGPVPADGNPIISDGDLLNRYHTVCARNRELLSAWDIADDLGLDAADVLDVQRELVAFSTELDDPRGRFKAGDLLITNGAIIPNVALLSLFQVGRDLGLDAVHFIGAEEKIIAFALDAAQREPSFWLNGQLVERLQRYNIDIWFSTEGTELSAATTQILDGYLLSARTGTVVVNQATLLPATVPADLPNRGVDFGLDAVTTTRRGDRFLMRFSTEILYRKEPAFNDGDILRFGDGVEIHHSDLVAPFEPRARFLGVDALYMHAEPPGFNVFLPWILRFFRGIAGGDQ
ncbi:MAG TPA: hypothetical protein G4O02_05740 [Caldilineae bacterium]|nr:hypothetical protein [Caldilineae bacterium]